MARAFVSLPLIALAWIVLSHGMALRSAAAGDVDAAIGWAPHSGDLLAMQAAQRQQHGDIQSARSSAIRALTLTPVSALALRVLGTTQLQGSAEELRLLEAANRLTHRDPPTQLALVLRDLQTGRVADAADHADALARTNGFDDQVASILDMMAVTPQGRQALISHLIANPSWRTSYLSSAASSVPSLLFRTALFDDLASGPTPPTRHELSSLIRELVGRGFYQVGWNEWQRSHGQATIAPESVGFGAVRTSNDDTIPFEWKLQSGTGVLVDLYGPETNVREIHVSQNGSTNAAFLSKLVILSPGLHTISVSARFSAPAARNAFQWQIACASPAGQQRILLRPLNGPNGLDATRFEMPDSPDCPAVSASLFAQQIDYAGTAEVILSRFAIS